MKEQYKILAANARKIAMDYDNKMSEEMKDGSGAKAMEYMELAKHHRSEATKYMQAAENL